jgi:hypothetical protein
MVLFLKESFSGNVIKILIERALFKPLWSTKNFFRALGRTAIIPKKIISPRY